MNCIVKPIQDEFVGEVSGIDGRLPLSEAEIGFVRDAIYRYGVLIFRDQALDDDQQLAFSRQFGPLHRSIASNRPDLARRVRSDEVSDISNVGADGSILSPEDSRRIQQRANLLWHTDNSFRDPAGAYTLLNARLVPPEAGETEFCDTRAAYEALPASRKGEIDDLTAVHALANSRRLAGTGGVFDEIENARYPAQNQPLVRVHEGSGRKALYIGSHAGGIVGMEPEAGVALLDDLLAHATQPRFVYRHSWRVGDLAMWDNRATLHRAMPFDELRFKRDLRRTAIQA